MHALMLPAGLKKNSKTYAISRFQVPFPSFPSSFLCSACAVFAQEPLFDKPDDEDPGGNYNLLVQAMNRAGVEVVGSAPYVEPTIKQAKKNIALILELAGRNRYHADFHLDYNLNPQSEPLIYEVIDITRRLSRYWRQEGLPERRITIGHATRLLLFTDAQWQDLLRSLRDLPISFVGLPNSDLYMQGREYARQRLGVPRGTLNAPQLAAKYGLQVAMSVNNVENAFTPQGSPDPFALCGLGAAMFQSATQKDIRTLIVPFYVLFISYPDTFFSVLSL